MPSLTRTEAEARGKLLTVTGYLIELDLSGAPDAAPFVATSTVRFSCAAPGADTFVEVQPVALESARLNGADLDPGTLAGNRLPLPGLAAENELVVRSTMAYSRTAEGLHRFVDPVDGEVYLYVNAPVAAAQRVFACFDQPDLKAPVTLAVTVPPGWAVWANGAGREVTPGRWAFAATPPLASYLVTLIAGRYHTRRAEHDGVPLGLACRRSLAADLDRDADELFGLTRAYLDRYHELFGSRYPFGEYKQAFVPEFGSGAVENPGLVTFREDFLFRTAVTEAERELRAVVVAHELAHMWFGGLVTLRWWNDVWLNEAFAEYAGWRVAAEVGGYPDAWATFAVTRKGWGYAADQAPSTHPVAAESVRDTAEAMLNFDGISYAKGASALRQLVAWLGDEAFLAGVRGYFAGHAFGNATLDDWLAALAGASGRDVAGWAAVWLRQPQVNTLRPAVVVDGGGDYAEVAVVQQAPAEHPTLRPHRIGIGVYDGVPPARVHRVEVDVTGARTDVPALRGLPAGRLLLLNDGDLTFAKVRFTEPERAALAGVLPALPDPLARAVVWSAAIDAARDGELAPAELIATAASALPVEPHQALFAHVLGFAVDEAAGRYLPADARPAALAALAGACARTLAGASPGSGRQLAAVRGVIACAGPADTPRLAGWLNGRGVPAGLAVDAELRWSALLRMVVLGLADEDAIAAQERRDPGPRGAGNAARCRAALPDPAAKARAWDRILHEDEPAPVLAAAAAGFWHPEQTTLTAEYVARFVAELPGLAARRTQGTVRQVAAALFPRYAVSTGTLAAVESMLDPALNPALDPALRRVVVDGAADLRRALRARELARPPKAAAAPAEHPAPR